MLGHRAIIICSESFKRSPFVLRRCTIAVGILRTNGRCSAASHSDLNGMGKEKGHLKWLSKLDSNADGGGA